MAGINDYLTGIEQAVGGRVSGGYRTQEEQDRLRAAGKTRAVKSTHSTGTPERPGAVDLVAANMDPAVAEANLRAAGFPNARVIYETGKGKNQGTGAHLHASLDGTGIAGGGAAKAGGSATPSNPPIPSVMRDQGSTSLPADGGPAGLRNPFDPGSLGVDLETADSRARAADTMLQQVINTEIPQNQEDRRVALEERNSTVEAVNSDITQRTTGFLNKVKPLFAQKEAIADRYRQVTEMNPLERGFMSLFDASYDRSHLREVDGAIDAQLGAAGQSYKAILDAQSTLLNVVDSNYKGDEQMNLLERGFIDEKLDLASKSFAASDLIISNTMKGFGAQSQLLAAQNQLKDQVITGLTPGQRATALSQAQANPDKSLTIQGAKFTEGELLQASQADAKQQVALDEMILSRETAQMNRSMTAQRMQEAAEEKLIGTMTTAQQRMAIQNGGVFNGTQLPLDKLGAGLNNSMARDKLVVEGTVQKGTLSVLADSIQGMANQSRLGHQRSMQLTGVAPPELVRQNDQVAQQIQQLEKKILSAPPEQRDAIAEQYLPQVQKLYQQQQAAIDQVANRWAGGNKKILPLAQAFLSGAPLNSTSAVQGLIEMARTNGSFGGGMSGPAAEALATAKRLVAEDATPAAGTDMASLMATPQGRVEKERALESRVAQAIGGVYQNSIFHRVVTQAPAIAKQIGHLGQNLNAETLAEAVNAGDQKGYEIIGSQLGISPDEAKLLFTTGGEKSPLWQKANHGDQGFNQWGSQLQVAQLQSTYRILDATHPKVGQYKAGQVYANLLGDDRFASAAGQMASMQGQASFGDSIMGAMGAGSIQGQVSQFGQVAQNAYRAMGQRDLLMRVAHSNRYANDPGARVNTIIGAIPGITRDDRDKLMGALKPMAAGTPSVMQSLRVQFGADNPGGFMGDPSGYGGVVNGGSSQFVMMRDAIMSGKFEDPALEKIRMKAAQHFDQYATITDEAIESLSSYTPGN